MIDKKDVLHVAALARLKLTDEEVLQYTKDLSAVLQYFDTLQKAPVEKVKPMTHVLAKENSWREDVSQPERPEIVARVLQLLPAVQDGFLKVKAVFSFK